MVWAGIMQYIRTPLHVFDNGSVNAQRYRQEVLGSYVRPFRGIVGPEFIFIDDIARSHRILMVDEHLESEDIQRMAKPANSPVLNLIEHDWDALERAIAMRKPPFRAILELKISLVGRMGGSTTNTP